jgi:hypothetical protein
LTEEEALESGGPPRLEALALDPWACRRRQELLRLLDQLNPWIADFDQAVEKEAERRSEAI